MTFDRKAPLIKRLDEIETALHEQTRFIKHLTELAYA